MDVGDDQDLAVEVGRLRDLVKERDEKIADLLSQLDKYRVLHGAATASSASGGGVGARAGGLAGKRKTRLLGISAEPALSASGAADT